MNTRRQFLFKSTALGSMLSYSASTLDAKLLPTNLTAKRHKSIRIGIPSGPSIFRSFDFLFNETNRQLTETTDWTIRYHQLPTVHHLVEALKYKRIDAAIFPRSFLGVHNLRLAAISQFPRGVTAAEKSQKLQELNFLFDNFYSQRSLLRLITESFHDYRVRFSRHSSEYILSQFAQRDLTWRDVELSAKWLIDDGWQVKVTPRQQTFTVDLNAADISESFLVDHLFHLNYQPSRPKSLILDHLLQSPITMDLVVRSSDVATTTYEKSLVASFKSASKATLMGLGDTYSNLLTRHGHNIVRLDSRSIPALSEKQNRDQNELLKSFLAQNAIAKLS